MMSDVPLEFLADRSELIVVAKVLRADKPLQMQILAPGENEPHKKLFTRYTLRVTKVIKDEAAAAKAKAAKVRPAPDKPDKPSAPRKITVLAKTPPAGRILGEAFVSLRGGRSYVLMLRAMPDRADYYLTAYHKRNAPATAEKIAEITKAADVNKWAWGKAADGLQAVLITSRRTARLQKSYVREPGGPRLAVLRISARIEFVIALRNTSDKAIRISLFPGDQCLKLQAAGPGGAAVSGDLYKEFRGKDYGAFGLAFTREIAPGKVMFLDAAGEARRTTIRRLKLTPGKWTFGVSFTATRKSVAPGGEALWTGKVKSAPVQIEVQDLRSPRRPRPAPGR